MSGQPRTLFRQQVLQDSLVRLRSQQRFRVVVRRHDVLHYCHQAPERTQGTIRTPLVRTITDATLILLQFLNMRSGCFCQGRPRNFGKQNIETPQNVPYYYLSKRPEHRMNTSRNSCCGWQTRSHKAGVTAGLQMICSDPNELTGNLPERLFFRKMK